MTDKRTVGHAANIDETFLAAHPKLAVLALDLPDSDGERARTIAPKPRYAIVRSTL
jgi:hypothetical protein